LSVHGRAFKTIEEARAFIAHYNAEWLIEKNGYLSPHATRRQHQLAIMRMVA
jgi:hypothetical protein